MHFKLNKFEGPLDLLLSLIESQELAITEINLAGLADQYIDYLRQADIGPAEVADFLLVASKLLLIKSKALLPYLYPEEEEEIEEFQQHLKMYQEFVKATKEMQKLLGKKRFMFAREYNRKIIFGDGPLFCPPPKLTANTLADIFTNLLTNLRPVIKLEERALERKINIEEKITAIKDLIFKQAKFCFQQLIDKAESKTDIIVSFLALLELAKQKAITIEQAGLFEDIDISRLLN